MKYLPVIIITGLLFVAGVFYLMRNRLNLDKSNWLFYKVDNSRKMVLLQTAFIVGIIIITFISIILKFVFWAPILFIAFSLSVVCIMVYYVIKENHKISRLLLICLGLRNILFYISFLIALSGISTGAYLDEEGNEISNFVFYNHTNAIISVAILLGTIGIYLGVKYMLVKNIEERADSTV